MIAILGGGGGCLLAFWLVKSGEGMYAELRFLNWCYVGADVVSPVTYQPWKERGENGCAIQKRAASGNSRAIFVTNRIILRLATNLISMHIIKPSFPIPLSSQCLYNIQWGWGSGLVGCCSKRTKPFVNGQMTNLLGCSGNNIFSQGLIVWLPSALWPD